MPGWMYPLAVLSLALAAVCAVIIAIDILAGHRQHMWIMNLVWPITALYAGPIALWAYYKVGRGSTRPHMQHKNMEKKRQTAKTKPFWQSAALGATHCGSGCTLGDIVAEWLLFFFPLAVMGQKIFAAWILDFILAFIFGIAFQYFTIKPMKGLSVKEGILAALKADTLSLTAWQVGMYGWMAIVTFGIVGNELEKTDPTFWFMMQIAMIIGFLTSYPVNWWLIKSGIKEKM